MVLSGIFLHLAPAPPLLGHDDVPHAHTTIARLLSHFGPPFFLSAHTFSLLLLPVFRPSRAMRLDVGLVCNCISLFDTASATRLPPHRYKQPLTGTVLTKHELVNLAKHPSRDIAALGLKGADDDADEDEERRVLDDIRSRGIPFSPLPLRRRLIGQSDALQIVGYEVRECPGGLGEEEDPGMMMVRASGELAARTASQAFVSTNHATLNPGMCGAAVLDSDMELCGCVEGVVPTPPPEADVEAHVRALQGMPCVVEWKDLNTLLKATMDDADSADDADDE